MSRVPTDEHIEELRNIRSLLEGADEGSKQTATYQKLRGLELLEDWLRFHELQQQQMLELLPALRDLTGHYSSQVRLKVLKATKKMLADDIAAAFLAKNVLPWLIRRLGDLKMSVRLEACRCLLYIIASMPYQRLFPALEEEWMNRSWRSKEALLRCIAWSVNTGTMQPKALAPYKEGLVVHVVQLLRDATSVVRAAAMDVLIELHAKEPALVLPCFVQPDIRHVHKHSLLVRLAGDLLVSVGQNGGTEQGIHLLSLSLRLLRLPGPAAGEVGVRESKALALGQLQALPSAGHMSGPKDCAVVRGQWGDVDSTAEVKISHLRRSSGGGGISSRLTGRNSRPWEGAGVPIRVIESELVAAGLKGFTSKKGLTTEDSAYDMDGAAPLVKAEVTDAGDVSSATPVVVEVPELLEEPSTPDQVSENTALHGKQPSMGTEDGTMTESVVDDGAAESVVESDVGTPKGKDGKKKSSLFSGRGLKSLFRKKKVAPSAPEKPAAEKSGTPVQQKPASKESTANIKDTSSVKDQTALSKDAALSRDVASSKHEVAQPDNGAPATQAARPLAMGALMTAPPSFSARSAQTMPVPGSKTVAGSTTAAGSTTGGTTPATGLHTVQDPTPQAPSITPMFNIPGCPPGPFQPPTSTLANTSVAANVSALQTVPAHDTAEHATPSAQSASSATTTSNTSASTGNVRRSLILDAINAQLADFPTTLRSRRPAAVDAPPHAPAPATAPTTAEPPATQEPSPRHSSVQPLPPSGVPEASVPKPETVHSISPPSTPATYSSAPSTPHTISAPDTPVLTESAGAGKARAARAGSQTPATSNKTRTARKGPTQTPSKPANTNKLFSAPVETRSRTVAASPSRSKRTSPSPQRRSARTAANDLDPLRKATNSVPGLGALDSLSVARIQTEPRFGARRSAPSSPMSTASNSSLSGRKSPTARQGNGSNTPGRVARKQWDLPGSPGKRPVTVPTLKADARFAQSTKSWQSRTTKNMTPMTPAQIFQVIKEADSHGFQLTPSLQKRMLPPGHGVSAPLHFKRKAVAKVRSVRSGWPANGSFCMLPRLDKFSSWKTLEPLVRAAVQPVLVEDKQPVREQLCQLHDTLTNMGAWEQRLEALEKLQQMLDVGSTKDKGFVPGVVSMGDVMALQISDRRTMLSRLAVQIVLELVYEMGNPIEHFAVAVVPALLKELRSLHRVRVEGASVCIDAMVHKIHSPHLIQAVAQNLIDSRQPTVRQRCCQYLTEMLRTWKSQYYRIVLSTIEEAILTAAMDHKPAVYSQAQSLYAVFKQVQPRLADRMLITISQEVSNRLLGKVTQRAKSPRVSMKEVMAMWKEEGMKKLAEEGGETREWKVVYVRQSEVPLDERPLPQY